MALALPKWRVAFNEFLHEKAAIFYVFLFLRASSWPIPVFDWQCSLQVVTLNSWHVPWQVQRVTGHINARAVRRVPGSFCQGEIILKNFLVTLPTRFCGWWAAAKIWVVCCCCQATHPQEEVELRSLHDINSSVNHTVKREQFVQWNTYRFWYFWKDFSEKAARWISSSTASL